ncbi:glycoside hydrolase family 18 protein [Chitinibacter fontanus]|uniref:chitinase n=1 Tax=Chitinibacter fontanus TaxID=1737446 RepID=A0A7D5ZCF4_9NEIS|nr:glycoside hydrolase family 18 protein [Chitinibacter fontanus]QLI80644.1 glycoside hydrolase family 18 protein [Chitinibacter fontanus]
MPRIFLAYLASWPSFDISTIPAEKLTHICYAFANIDDGRVVLPQSIGQEADAAALERAEQQFIQLQALKQKNPKLKLMISIGGWGADGFSDAALTEQSRAEFAESAVQFMLMRQLDGIDLDWEYPSNAMAGITAREQDRHNFSLLLQAVRQRLDLQSELEPRTVDARYQLSIAAGAGQYYLDGIEVNQVAQACDFINLMTYDFYNGWAKQAGHHANLYRSASDPLGDSADDGVALFRSHGVPAEKLVLGCPMYGRALAGVGAPGLGALGCAGSNTAPSFRQIETELLPSGRFQRYWDATAQAPWLFDGDRFISYEDQESIALKGRYVRQQQLAGAMFWELTEDHQFSLLSALHEAIYS